MKKYFVTAIGTDSGKTFISAILTQALHADYWKPIQAGTPRDTETVQALVSNEKSTFWPEAYLLKTPMSPHAAAALENIRIDLQQITLPKTTNHLVIEGAGGILVPINPDEYVIDVAAHLQAEIILVCNLYLGSINHSLLSINELKRRNLPVKGIIFNGEPNAASEEIILEKSKWLCLLRVPKVEMVTPQLVSEYANQLTDKLL
jgi:dethiobiotin synthetase